MNNYYFDGLLYRLSTITVYKNILDDDILKAMSSICTHNGDKKKFFAHVGHLFHLLIVVSEKHNFRGNVLKHHIIRLLANDENPFSIACENGGSVFDGSLFGFARKDIRTLLDIGDNFIFELSTYFEEGQYAFTDLTHYRPMGRDVHPLSDTDALPDNEQVLYRILSYYKEYGCGILAHHKMLRYDSVSGLVAIENSDPIRFADIIGYDIQKELVIHNTSAFLHNQPGNNCLLIGSRGTGKSSCVKALANQFFADGLRIIELTKDQLEDIPKLLALLKNRGRKFIIFIDDLSFDDHEIGYKHLKSLMEGGTEIKPSNVLFYATSNRRHLIQEKWSDRVQNPDDDEVHTTDTQNEKLALSDRFGITITFPKPTKQQYLEIVKGLAQQYGVEMDEQKLESEAMKHELNQKGMSGRGAKQFIHELLSQ